jgi:hypothetical protein
VDVGDGAVSWKPHPYSHTYHAVAEALMKNRCTVLEMWSGADDICVPCSHNINGLCDDVIDTTWRPEAPESKREWNLLLDNRWYTRLGLKDGDELTALDFVRKVKTEIAGGIGDIYREIPADRNSKRLESLTAGIAKYLGET